MTEDKPTDIKSDASDTPIEVLTANQPVTRMHPEPALAPAQSDDSAADTPPPGPGSFTVPPLPEGNDPRSARRFLTMGSLVLILLVGGFGGWATFTKLSGAVIATGQIEVDQNRQVVQHPDGGIVSEILVDDGDAVEPGDVLIKLDGTLLASELSIISGQLYELMARRGRLEAERDDFETLHFEQELLVAAAEDGDIASLVSGQERLFHARRETLDRERTQLQKRQRQIDSQLEGIDAQQDAMAQQLELLNEELADQRTLMESGLAQKSRVLSLQREQARLSGELGELLAARAEGEGRITELEIEALKLDTQRREEAITRLRDLQYREFELAEQRRALVERLDRLDMKAPVSGLVHGLTVFAPRSVIRAADPVLFLIPQDRPLVIATRVEPIHIDQVYPGQEVMLRFSALDARTTPELKGSVTQISADSFTDENTGVSYYRTELVLQEGEIDRLPEGAALLPGMPVEAFIRTEDRTPLAYLLKPLSDYFVKAFRES